MFHGRRKQDTFLCCQCPFNDDCPFDKEPTLAQTLYCDSFVSTHLAVEEEKRQEAIKVSQPIMPAQRAFLRKHLNIFLPLLMVAALTIN